MSTRTIIEINHDYLHDLTHEPGRMVEVLRALASCDLKRIARNAVPGVRVLGQRPRRNKDEHHRNRPAVAGPFERRVRLASGTSAAQL